MLAFLGSTRLHWRKGMRGLWLGALTASLLACQHPSPTWPPDNTVSGLPVSQAQPSPSQAPALSTAALPENLATETPALSYTLSVSRVNVQDFLYALVRESAINADIHPDIQGSISLNAVKQTLTQILDRLAHQVDLRYEWNQGVLRILPDTPYLVHYPVDYVNLQRHVSTSVSANTQIASGPGSDLRAMAQSNSSAGNISTTRLENVSQNQFWVSLEKNIQDILRETDKLLPEGSSDTFTEAQQQHKGFDIRAPQAAFRGRGGPRGSSTAPPVGSSGPNAEASQGERQDSTVVRTRNFREAASVMSNPEGGLISVRATARQHASVKAFLAHSLQSARRQVLIEATIVEVELSEGYQQGIDWARVRDDGSQQFSLTRASIGGDPNNGVLPFALRSQDKRNPLSSSVAVDLLRTFGRVKVLSSPRLAVLNQQTALLKVVENIVYFNVKADTLVTANVGQTTTVSTTPQSVSVGLVLAVTPQISASEQIILNVRPTISSIAKFVPDPNPVIPIPNQVPQIRTREIESLLSIQAGEMAVLGGLMEERQESRTGQLPGLADIPLIGELFTTRNDSQRKSELVVFLRPVIQGPTEPTPLNRPTLPLNEASLAHWDQLDAAGLQANYVEALETYCREHPQSALAQLALGHAYSRRAQWPAAQQAYFSAHLLAPKHPFPLESLASTYAAQGQTHWAEHYRAQARSLVAPPHG